VIFSRQLKPETSTWCLALVKGRHLVKTQKGKRIMKTRLSIVVIPVSIIAALALRREKPSRHSRVLSWAR
jgi:hypothetical protein